MVLKRRVSTGALRCTGAYASESVDSSPTISARSTLTHPRSDGKHQTSRADSLASVFGSVLRGTSTPIPTPSQELRVRQRSDVWVRDYQGVTTRICVLVLFLPVADLVYHLDVSSRASPAARYSFSNKCLC